MTTRRYPRTLSTGANNTVIALSDAEVGKIFHGDTRSDIGSEAEKMQYANRINGLVVRFIRLASYSADAEMLVMERLYPLDYRTLEFEKRELIIDVFQDGLSALHSAGFVHRDIRRPSNLPGYHFDNVFLTESGIRLIDVGISALRSQVGEQLFSKFVAQEIEELAVFKEYFLNR